MATTASGSALDRGDAVAVYRISVDEYDRMVAAGVLDDPGVELVQGLLVRKMGKNPPHVLATRKLERRLEPIVPPGWHIRKEDPIRIPSFDEPEPDLAVVAGAVEDYGARHPGPADVAMIVEVAETTLDYDRGAKLLAYAAGQVPVYWIVNLVARQIEVYTDPGPNGYLTRQDFPSGCDVPVVIAGVEHGRISVADILP
jgi:Uma2 family endonuclease